MRDLKVLSNGVDLILSHDIIKQDKPKPRWLSTIRLLYTVWKVQRKK